jgi:hypothetical protein
MLLFVVSLIDRMSGDLIFIYYVEGFLVVSTLGELTYSTLMLFSTADVPPF